MRISRLILSISRGTVDMVARNASGGDSTALASPPCAYLASALTSSSLGAIWDPAMVPCRLVVVLPRFMRKHYRAAKPTGWLYHLVFGTCWTASGQCGMLRWFGPVPWRPCCL